MAMELECVSSNVHLDFMERGLFRELDCDFLNNGEKYTNVFSMV